MDAISLRRTFGTSYQALLLRLKEIGALSEREMRKWKELPLWSLERRLFGESPSISLPAPSGLLWELALEAAFRGELTLSACADILGLSPAEVQDILAELEEAGAGAEAL